MDQWNFLVYLRMSRPAIGVTLNKISLVGIDQADHRSFSPNRSYIEYDRPRKSRGQKQWAERRKVGQEASSHFVKNLSVALAIGGGELRKKRITLISKMQRLPFARAYIHT